MRHTKFAILLFVLFCSAFFWASGSVLSLSSPTAPAWLNSGTDFIHRSYRLLDFKGTVNNRLDREHYVRLINIPLSMQQAIVAIEDHRFYNHGGFDVEGILRAALVNLQTGSLQEGGSTITQQLVKNLFLTQDRTFARKVEEFFLAIIMESSYSKEEILEMYLNTIYFGAGAYGIGEASQVYFAKPPQDLTLGEATLLAGLPRAPSVYSPYTDITAARERQSVVLATMVRQGLIGPGQAQAVKNTPLQFSRKIMR
jgi:penicillin-binding protein 1A